MIFKTQQELETYGEKYMQNLLQGNDLHDCNRIPQRLDLLKWGTWPLLGRPVFDILLELDECIKLAQIPTFHEECSHLGFEIIAGKVYWIDK